MEWKTKSDGDTRERVIFAWFPIECEDGKTRWLTKIRVVEKCHWYGGDMLEPPTLGWQIFEAYPIDGQLVAE
jgi:hypothetical protein